MNGFPEKILLATDGLVSTAAARAAAVDLTEKGDKQGRIVRGIAVARTEKASIRVEVACDPCKRQRRERRHY